MKTTLRELINTAITTVLVKEHLFPEQLNELVEYMLDNSHVILDDTGSLSLLYGNVMGVGDSNKDKLIETPKFILFEFRKANPITNVPHRWRLTTFETFSKLDDHLIMSVDRINNKLLVLIDGFIIDFCIKVAENGPKFKRGGGAYTEWEPDVFRLEYVGGTEICNERYASKYQTELRILQLIKDGANEIKAYNILDDARIKFVVQGNICKSFEGDSKYFNGEPTVLWLPEVIDDGPCWPDLPDLDDSDSWGEPEF